MCRVGWLVGLGWLGGLGWVGLVGVWRWSCGVFCMRGEIEPGGAISVPQRLNAANQR